MPPCRYVILSNARGVYQKGLSNVLLFGDAALVNRILLDTLAHHLCSKLVLIVDVHIQVNFTKTQEAGKQRVAARSQLLWRQQISLLAGMDK
jgi:hypothetical protein